MSLCNFCRHELEHSFCNLGTSPRANAYLNVLTDKEPFYPLHVSVCSHCFLTQLSSFHQPTEMFSEYAYFSSYSSSWLEHSKKYAKMAIERFKLTSASQVIEVASNDGYLLQYFKEEGIPVLGIEPAQNIAKTALEKGIPTLPHFFGTAFARQMSVKADLLIGNNVLAHVPDLNDFVVAMKSVLNPQGVITMEFPHLLRLIEENQFDTIYHEHCSYFSLFTIRKIFAYHGLEIFDVDLLPTHGGSLRIYAKHQEDGSKRMEDRVLEVLDLEEKKGLMRLETYTTFESKVTKVKENLVAFLAQVQHEGKTIVAYGAPAKGNTLLNYCGLSERSIPFTVDRNHYKQGKFLPGSHIPIFSPEKIDELKPDYLLILPWNLKNEIMEETRFIRNWGGKFVVPIPRLEVMP